MSPEARSLRSRLGGLTTAANGTVNTGPARAAFAARFYAGLPEDLPQAERDRRANAARRLYFARMAYQSVQARRRGRSSTSATTTLAPPRASQEAT